MVNPHLAYGDQPQSEDEGVSSNILGLSTLGAGTAAAAAIGFIPWGEGRIWDKYIGAIRAVETGSPGGVLNTFRVSELLSPLESWQNISVDATNLDRGIYGNYLKRTFGEAETLDLKRTGQVFGEIRDEAGKLRGIGVQIEASTQKGTGIADYAARIGGTPLAEHQSLNDAILRNQWEQSGSSEPFQEWVQNMDPQLRRQRLIIGSKIREEIRLFGQKFTLSENLAKNVAKLETTGKVLQARAAATANRLNILLKAPVELPVVKWVADKIPGLKHLGVEAGTATQVLGRYVKKGLVLAAAWKGLEYVDHLRAEGSPWGVAVATGGGAVLGSILATKPGAAFSKGGLMAGAAIGLAASIAPRFENGIIPGVTSVYADATLAKAKTSEAIGFTDTIAEQEQITPGLIQPSTAIAFGGIGSLVAGFASYVPFLSKAIKERYKTKQPLSQIFETMREQNVGKAADAIWDSSIGRAITKLPGGKTISKIKHPMALGFAAGVATWGVTAFALSATSGNPTAPVAGLLGTDETTEELERMYSGEEEVPVRKGRFWEMGRSTKYSGGRIEYYRPHAIARINSRAYQQGIYGDEEERWEHDPLLNPIKALFGSDEWKYHYEQKYQYERPATTTSTYGEDIPFIGPVVAATFGKLFKPRKLVRPEEWDLGGGKYIHHPDIRGEAEPSYELGGLGPGAPVAKESGSQLLNELNYRRREAIGLPGFIEGALTKKAIGREELFENKQTLSSMGKETGSEYWMWKHLNLGGAAGTSELARRFTPRQRSYLEEYNPLPNALPSWLPDDSLLDLKYGNPFSKIPEAEIRLPGPGFAALHPELKGVDPEDYPLAYRAKILGDVAMWSPEYRSTIKAALRGSKDMPEHQARIVLQTEKQVEQKKRSKDFQERVFTGDQLDSQTVTISEVLGPRRFRAKEFGDLVIEAPGVGEIKDPSGAMAFAAENLLGQRVQLYTPALRSRKYKQSSAGVVMSGTPIVGGTDYGAALADQGFAETDELPDELKRVRFSPMQRFSGRVNEFMLHDIESPLESLTPLSPAAKLIRQRSAVEDYAASEAIGTSNAFWDKPIENFIKPTLNMSKYKAGIVDIPDEVEERRNINEYFDMLQWVKMSRLEKTAKVQGEAGAAERFRRKKEKTVFGVDTFKNPLAVLNALPRKEKPYFSEFFDATTDTERAKIL